MLLKLSFTSDTGKRLTRIVNNKYLRSTHMRIRGFKGPLITFNVECGWKSTPDKPSAARIQAFNFAANTNRRHIDYKGAVEFSLTRALLTHVIAEENPAIAWPYDARLDELATDLYVPGHVTGLRHGVWLCSMYSLFTPIGRTFKSITL